MVLISYTTRLYNFISRNPAAIYLALTIYWVIIFILTSIPAKSMPAFGVSDKFEHLGAYMVLAFLLNLAFHFQKRFLFAYRQIIIICAAIGIVYGLLDELHQLLIPGRFFDWFDLLANTIGIILGLFFSGLFIKYGKLVTK